MDVEAHLDNLSELPAAIAEDTKSSGYFRPELIRIRLCWRMFGRQGIRTRKYQAQRVIENTCVKLCRDWLLERLLP